jgi:hypothetical protein
MPRKKSLSRKKSGGRRRKTSSSKDKVILKIIEDPSTIVVKGMVAKTQRQGHGTQAIMELKRQADETGKTLVFDDATTDWYDRFSWLKKRDDGFGPVSYYYNPRSRTNARKRIVRETLLERAHKQKSHSTGGWSSRSNMPNFGVMHISRNQSHMKVDADDRAWAAEGLIADTWSNVRVDPVHSDDYYGIFRVTYTNIPDDASQQLIDKLRYDCNHAFTHLFGKNIDAFDIWHADGKLGVSIVVYNSWNKLDDKSTRHAKILTAYESSGMMKGGKYAIDELDEILDRLKHNHGLRHR